MELRATPSPRCTECPADRPNATGREGFNLQTARNSIPAQTPCT